MLAAAAGFRSVRVFAKLCTLVVSVCAVACVLLALRQQRIEAVHQMAMTNLRIMESDRGLAKLRTQIVARLEPSRIQELAARLGDLQPIELVPARPGTPPAGAQPVYAQARGRAAQQGERAPGRAQDGAFGGGVNRR